MDNAVAVTKAILSRMDPDKLQTLFTALSPSITFGTQVLQGNAKINTKIESMKNNLNDPQADNINNCKSGKKLELDSPLNMELLLQLASTEDGPIGTHLKNAKNVTIKDKKVFIDGKEAKNFREIVMAAGAGAFDKKCSITDVYKQNLAEGIKKDIKELKQIQNSRDNVLTDGQSSAALDAKSQQISRSLKENRAK